MEFSATFFSYSLSHCQLNFLETGYLDIDGSNPIAIAAVRHSDVSGSFPIRVRFP